MTETNTLGDTNTSSESRTEGETESVSLSPTPLHRTRQESQPTGRLQSAIDDQFAKSTQALMSLDSQHCIVSLTAFHSSFEIRVANVQDPFALSHASPEWINDIVKRFHQEIIGRHSYCFSHQEVTPLTGDKPSGGEGKFADGGVNDVFG